ncbi:MAG: hypothetical protein IPM18_03925 [Phycisphaerales bacterium]|nr:hypothetical protein [Phycisphaerales bacterium]
MQLQIDDEYDRLEAVLVHRPGAEIQRLHHENMRRFLFEDVPYLRRMQDEHDAFVDRMRAEGIEVLYLGDLLRAVLEDEKVRAAVVAQVTAQAGVPAIAEDLITLRTWDLDALVEMLFAGLTAEEYHAATGRRIARGGGDAHFLLEPIPNAYFARDPAVVVRNAAISSKMHYPQRIRETLLARAVLEQHPVFSGNEILFGRSDAPHEDRPYTLEGGDVIMLSSEALLVGASERTRSETIELLAGKYFRAGKLKRVYEIPIPTERAFMHLDTVFTIVDRGVVLWFGPVIAHLSYIHRYEAAPERPSGARRLPEERPFAELLRDEFGMELTIIETAGGSRHFAAREQRADGANAFAIAPRTTIVYERNEFTIAALEAHGVRCIGIDDSELVRGLGGPRCMTMPLRRVSAH